MLTVRIVYPNNVERLIETVSVVKDLIPSEHTSGQVEIVRLYSNNEISESIDEGNIYVMNESGSTIAKFILGQKISEVSGK